MSRYSISEAWLQRAEMHIPLGSQTFSKSRTQYPVGVSPLFTDEGKGAYVWDIDGNKYVDLVNALGAVTLGHRNRQVNSEIKRQLRKGITFSLPSRLESVLAEKLVDIIPAAEMVRFSKTGTDSTTAAIRIARSFTKRDHVISCGYHGWQDWSIGVTSRNSGIPDEVRKLTHIAEYNNLQSFKDLFEMFPNEIACVIIEPMTYIFPLPGFLQELKDLTTKNGAVLIFDETVTGFRFALAGAQELFGVVPDLATFGKGIANGMPLSALVGKKEIMNEYEEAFISGTFGGETLSIAAAISCISIFQKENVQSQLATSGAKLAQNIANLAADLELDSILNLKGHDSWKFLIWEGSQEFTALEIRALFMQEAFKEGLLVLGTHNVSYAMDDKVLKVTTTKYRNILERISTAIKNGSVRHSLKVDPLQPLFSVRS